tara:strand:- start:744 stop:1847 length:1104 start_codon:yes stop_codon:yes gene_type:complete
MAIAGGNITLDSTEGMDKISQTEKVTSPYFSDGSTTLAAASIVSSSLTDTNETYFFGISNSSTPTVEEFNVAFGSTNGYGSNDNANAIKAPTDAIYKQYANLLLAPTEVTGGFHISNQGSAGKLVGKDSEIFILTSRRSNMKDRINKGTWTVALSGSNTADTAGQPILHLTDDSVNNNPTATPAGDRYNIVSGSAGTVVAGHEATVKNYGFFYPDMGVLLFSQAELSASIPGKGANLAETVIFDKAEHKGFGVSTDVDSNEKTALRFINCLQGTGAKLTFRDEEDQVSAQYFCRVRSGQMNFSNNPTYVSGSLNELRQKTMKGNPSTFISSVQLYNSAGEMVAIGNLSTPLKKTFSSEATIKVKLTY